MRARAETGFTLVELMVALAIFALAAIALVNLLASSVRTTQALETRAFAQVVAENQAVDAMTVQPMPPLGRETGTERLGMRDWEWTRIVEATADPDIVRIDISVGEAGERGVASSLVLFRGRR